MCGSGSPIRAAGGSTEVIRFEHSPRPVERESTSRGEAGPTSAFGCD
jgi:hypothetical protein